MSEAYIKLIILLIFSYLFEKMTANYELPDITEFIEQDLINQVVEQFDLHREETNDVYLQKI